MEHVRKTSDLDLKVKHTNFIKHGLRVNPDIFSLDWRALSQGVGWRKSFWARQK